MKLRFWANYMPPSQEGEGTVCEGKLNVLLLQGKNFGPDWCLGLWNIKVGDTRY